jgi:RNA polymerase sigma-70 factor (sigma-E family)
VAEDLVQETMVKAYAQWRRVARADSPDLYVRRVLTNTYLSWRRGGWFRRTVLHAEVPDTVATDGTDTRALHQYLWERLRTLPPRQRAAVVLRFYEDLPDAQIAEVLGCAVGTVRSLISRALTSLREVMGVSAVQDRMGGQS